MPRSFLVKKHHGKRPKNGRLRPPEPEEAPRDPREDPLLNDGVPLRHRALAQRDLSLSSSSSCTLPLQADRLHPPPSLSRGSTEPRGPLEACTKEDLEIRHVRGQRRRPESVLPPSLPFLALCPTVPPGGGEEALGCPGWSFPGLAKRGQLSSTCFSCRYCEKEYVSQGALKMHIRTHTLPCVCEVCGKAFSRPWLLQGHMRTHTGEKPFSCLHCSRAFADRSNLRAHLQTHSHVKKHQCGGCFKTFSRISLLAKHQDAGCLPC